MEVKLFETLGRKVRLTRAGEEMLRISEEILPKLGGIKERLAEVEGLKKGKIRRRKMHEKGLAKNTI